MSVRIPKKSMGYSPLRFLQSGRVGSFAAHALLVTQVADWPYSSLRRHVAAGIYGANWAMTSIPDSNELGDSI